MTKKMASVCGFAFGKCIKFYLFSMLPAVWFWFPVLCIAKLFDECPDGWRPTARDDKPTRQ